ncbi:MAG: hypothetical protein AAFQ67_03590 [Pseudomonadota bacterium]
MKLNTETLLGFGNKADDKNDTMVGTKGGNKKKRRRRWWKKRW